MASLLEESAREAVQDYGLANKRTRGNRVAAVKYVQDICGVPLPVAQKAIDAAEAEAQSQL